MPHSIITALAALAMIACNAQQEAVSPDLDWEECESEALGYTVAYPAGWHTNDPGEMGPCRLFHPEPFEVPYRAGIPLDIAVIILVEEVAVEETLGEPIGKRLLEETRLEVAGREAWRFLLHSTGEGFLPEDVIAYRYHVDANGSTLIAATYGERDRDFERNRGVLDEMMERLRIHP
jgi:hypothetical protein